jgi:hypothetical protein
MEQPIIGHGFANWPTRRVRFVNHNLGWAQGRGEVVYSFYRFNVRSPHIIVLGFVICLTNPVSENEGAYDFFLIECFI